jgi:DNA-binding NarL/FixJ family response regulator
MLIQVVASHPLLASYVRRTLAADPELEARLVSVSAEDSSQELSGPRLFLLDCCSLAEELTEICNSLRRQCPGSKFLALVPPDRHNDQQMLRQLCAGIDGFVELSEAPENELCNAVRAIFSGHCWVPTPIVREFLNNAKMLLEKRVPPDCALTARERQIFHLLLRRFSNKEIAAALTLSERTVKFHVSNLLAKVGLRNRRELLRNTEPLLASARGSDSSHPIKALPTATRKVVATSQSMSFYDVTTLRKKAARAS